MTRRTAHIDGLEAHPNLGEIVGVLAQLAHIQDADLVGLAQAWDDSHVVRSARAAALMPDSPLVLEVLAAFEGVGALFADDLRGEASYLTVPSDQVRTALCAVRDAIAGAYAQPVLHRSAHAALLAPWRSMYPTSTVVEPDLGPQAARVKALLALLPLLSGRCHDGDATELYDALSVRALVDESDRAAATQQAFDAAVLTSRRRVWALVRRTGTEAFARPCTQCHRASVSDGEQRRVLTLCLDAACALLVADAVSERTTELLTEPVVSLIPRQRDEPS